MQKRRIREKRIKSPLAVMLFVLYIAALFALLLLKWLPVPGLFPPSPPAPDWSSGSYKVNLKPFHSLELFWKARGNALSESDVWKNLWGNILVFFPFAPLASLLSRKVRPLLIFLSGLCLILLIELIQLISGIGVWDIDDILLNSIGLIGGMIFLIPRLMRQAGNENSR